MRQKDVKTTVPGTYGLATHKSFVMGYEIVTINQMKLGSCAIIQRAACQEHFNVKGQYISLVTILLLSYSICFIWPYILKLLMRMLLNIY